LNRLKPSSSRIILLGGYYHHNAQALIGPLVYQNAEMFAPRKFFISAGGFSQSFGFTGDDYLQTQTLRDLAKKTEQIIMLFDSEKFRTAGGVKLFSIKEINTLYTDDQIPLDKENYFLSKRVSIHKAPSGLSAVYPYCKFQ
jgi:DeoR/GlpR family transcriptional regulator of sugar metabolism